MNAPTPDALYAIQVARLQLMQRAGLGLLGEIGYSLNHKADASIATAATDGKALLYRPEFILALDEQQRQGLLAHEYAHVALMHPVRIRPGMDPETANIAMDHAANLMLLECGMTLPQGAYADPRFSRMAWEHIYTLLMEEKEQQQQPEPEPEDDAPEEEEDDQSEDGEGPDGDGPPSEPMDGEEDGDGEPDEFAPPAPGKPGDQGGPVRPYPGKDGQPATDAELSEATAELSDRILQIATAMEQAGTGSPNAARLVEQMTTPRDPDLYEALARLMERSASDHTWRRPNRRLLHAGFFPGLDGEECPPLVVVVDTSGSITDRIIAAFNDKVSLAVAHFRPRAVTVIYCDDAVQGEPQTYDPDSFPGIAPHGGGGTDFRPPFAWVEEHAEDMPAALVYLTDLEGRFPAEPPAYPVIWGAVPSWRQSAAPFGQTVRLSL